MTVPRATESPADSRRGLAEPGRPKVLLVIPEDVLSRYEAGELHAADVARLCGVSVQTVLRRLQEAGVDTARHRGAPPKHLAIEPNVLAQYATGEINHSDVARIYEVGEDTALRELRRNGADTSRGTRRRLQAARRQGQAGLSEEAVRLYRDGMSLRQVAAQLGVTHTAVRNVLVRAGVLRRATRPEAEGA